MNIRQTSIKINNNIKLCLLNIKFEESVTQPKQFTRPAVFYYIQLCKRIEYICVYIFTNCIKFRF